MAHTVGLLRCADYDVAALLTVFSDALNLIGFDTKPVRGKTCLLKPNMLGAYPPDMGITTHPSFLEAAIILFRELGCKVWVGDSANGIFPIDCVWERTGIREVCKRHGVVEKVFEREGGVIRDDIFIAKPVFEADFVVNLPRLKTHGLTVLTVATKNLFGCVPGLQKTRYHQKFADRKDFAKLMVRIAEIAKPALNLVDGIVAMEGNGPSAGALVKMNTVIAGTNHHAVDTVCAKLIGLDPIHVDTIEAATSMGVWNPDDRIDIVGETIDSCKHDSFNLPSTFTKGMRDWWLARFVIHRIWDRISIKPKISKKRCQRCGLCVKSCPVGAITEGVIANEVRQSPEPHGIASPKGLAMTSTPRVIANKCIQCYCCHEVCPYKAIDLNESLGVRVWRFFGERRMKMRAWQDSTLRHSPPGISSRTR